MLSIAVFAICMAIKGGWLAKIPGYTKTFSDKIEGTYLSGLILSAYINPVFGVFWALGNRPRMNDPAGDWKLAVQRGVFTGACLTFATGLTHLIDPDSAINTWYILAGATMPLWYRLALKISKGQSWAWAEIYWGAVFGIAYIIPTIL